MSRNFLNYLRVDTQDIKSLTARIELIRVAANELQFKEPEISSRILQQVRHANDVLANYTKYFLIEYCAVCKVELTPNTMNSFLDIPLCPKHLKETEDKMETLK
jgi:hypothetical protein